MTRTKIISGGVLTLGFGALGITTADAHSIYKTKELVVNDTFNVKAKESENTVTKKKPVDLFAILDGSPSFTKQGKFDKALNDLTELVKSLPEGSNVIFSTYLENNKESYTANKTQAVTKLLSKTDALDFLDKVKKHWIDDPQGYLRLRSPFVLDKTDTGFIKDANDLGTYKYLNTTPFTNIEEVYNTYTGKNKVMSVVQFTDEWEPNENIDTTFVDWAKKNAKTFMSVLYYTENLQNTKSETSMTEANHPNIYRSYGVSDSERSGKIIEQFNNTGLETTTTKERERVDLDIKLTRPDGSVLTDAKVTSPSGKEYEIKQDGTLQIPDAEDDEYKITYKVNKGRGKVRTVVQANGNEIKVIEHELQVVDISNPERFEEIPYTTKNVDDDTLEVGKTRIIQKGVNGEKTIKQLPAVEDALVLESEFDVKDGSNISIDLTKPQGAQFIKAIIETPEGVKEFEFNGDKATFNLKNAKAGKYTIKYTVVGTKDALNMNITVNGNTVNEHNDKLLVGVTTKGETIETITKKPVEEIIGVGTLGYEIVKEIKETDSEYKLDYSDAHEYGKVYGDSGLGKKKVEVSKKYKTIKGVRVGEPIEVTERVIEDNQDPKKLGTHDTYVVTKTEIKKREVEYIDDDTIDAGTTKIVKDGRNGLVRITSTWNTYKGYKTGEPTVTEEVIYAPDKQVIKRGTKVKVDKNKKAIDDLSKALRLKEGDLTNAKTEEKRAEVNQISPKNEEKTDSLYEEGNNRLAIKNFVKVNFIDKLIKLFNW